MRCPRVMTVKDTLMRSRFLLELYTLLSLIQNHFVIKVAQSDLERVLNWSRAELQGANLALEIQKNIARFSPGRVAVLGEAISD